MTRISSLAQQQALVSQMLRAQTQVAESQRQVLTGEKADRYEGITRDASALISAQAIDSRTQKFIELANQVSGQVILQDTSLNTMYETAKGLRDSILQALGNNTGRSITVDLESAFVSGKAVLNTRYAGKFLFAGTRTDLQPFSAVDVADLATVASPISSFFKNSEQKLQVRVEQNLVIEHSLLASDIGSNMMASVKRLAEYNAATPFGNVLTPADRVALQAEVTNLDNALSAIIQLQASNGFVGTRLESVTIRNQQLEVVNKQLIADLSEVDMAEAISRLNQDKLAVEASYNLVRQISQLTLLNFL